MIFLEKITKSPRRANNSGGLLAPLLCGGLTGERNINMMPTFTMRQLLEAGVHFGHQTQRWNPKMGPYLYGSRGGIHIIDLQQTVPMLHHALQAIRDVVAAGGR